MIIDPLEFHMDTILTIFNKKKEIITTFIFTAHHSYNVTSYLNSFTTLYPVDNPEPLTVVFVITNY